MLGRKFWNISNLNLLYILCNLPFFFFLYTLTGQLDTQISAVADPLYPAFYGMLSISKSPELLALNPLFAKFVNMSIPTVVTKIFWGISLLTIFTFGLSNVGSAYVVRSLNRGDPVFMFSDFFGTIKRNFRQGIVVGIMDLAISFLLIWDFIFWNAQPGFVNAMFYYASLFLLILYFFMRFYIYTLLITFDLSIFKIFKNAFIFAILGIKRNLLGALGIIAAIALNSYLFTLLPPIGIVLPLIITIALCCFISGYASYPVIKKYMIDPYYPQSDETSQNNNDAIFEDRG